MNHHDSSCITFCVTIVSSLLTMFRPDQTARNYLRQKLLPKIQFSQLDRPEHVDFGEVIEIQAEARDISESVLSLIFHFLIGAESGLVYHFSTADNLYHSLQQSKLDILDSPIAIADKEKRIKAKSVHSCKQLQDIFDYLRNPIDAHTNAASTSTSSLEYNIPNYEPTLLILESLSPILYAEKVTQILLSILATLKP